ncbi:glycosyltransferase family 2 protein [Oligoflexus tunisiensis]|uniref:glycosyltransferase family 2 protein n=1 Tax=Oligoflexus tunisiensis TaxID=708132 RepID=UPI00114CA751|nr:glycosyltransferase family 2 protein [Oligoflexus tunisiensis]
MLPIALLALQIIGQAITLPFSWLMFRIWDTAVRRLDKAKGAQGEPITNFVILVPAHNEEGSIATTVRSLRALDYPRQQFEILVIADNCQDQTANVARNEGAEVLERFHDTKKSKGFALEYALETLQKREHQPDAVVIIDADTTVDADLLKAFDRRLQSGQDWLQAYYTVSNSNDSWRTQMMRLGFAHFNGLWLLGQDTLGLGSALRGNGMAFSWNGLQRCPWQAYGLAEDLEFSWHLRMRGERVFFVPEVKVYGEMIDNNPAAVASQRLRWEHGRKQLRKTFGRTILRSRWPLGRRFTYWSDLNMPPLAGFALRLLLTLGIAILFYQTESTELIEGIQGICLGLAIGQLLNFAIYLTMPFVVMDIPRSYFKLFFIAPFYAAWKAGLWLKRAPATWVRTERKNRQGPL